MKTFLFAVFFTCISCSLFAQDEGVVSFTNPSFEDQPHRGSADFPTVKDWTDCGRKYFPGESPPDIHPGDFWEVTKPSSQGNTYLGMVARYNDSWESLSQRLERPLLGSTCYTFEVDLSQSNVYLSRTHRNKFKAESFTTPCVLRIWAGSTLCSKAELLGESPQIDHLQWKSYGFTFQPKRDFQYITIEIFYKTPVLFPYNGNILVDNMSDMIPVPCPGQVIASKEIIRESTKDLKPIMREEIAERKPLTVDQVIPERPDGADIGESKSRLSEEELAINEVRPDRKLLKELDGRTVKKGQTIKVDKLYFPQDSVNFKENSYEVLNEIFFFLAANENVIVEIGGHTNGLPKDEYCDVLSTQRAKAVKKYLEEQGIESERLEYKGYGKRKPIASNKTRHGRSLNQRVEIKILSIDG